ncbi:FUSC family protein [Halomonas salipaludis]|uniref:FUSC family protein n=1 Tax=Halomonas salipaludis TaxID=2032625 RepID=A0A2A2EVT6_9GAMM|nr:FUSC family protein [Halomonas salipaludis]PAU76778.1 FUSC family protein [Halomonas salipaludis]
MYVAPGPRVEDDPLFAFRLATAAVIGLLVALLLQSSLPMVIPVLMVGLMGGMRRAFDPRKAIGGPLAMIVIMSLYAALVSLTRPMPAVLILLVGINSVLAYYLILRTGSPIGMLLLIGIVLMSVMGMSSPLAMEVVRDAFIEAGLVALVVIPVLYALLPPASKERFVEDHRPASEGHHGMRALIRGCVLLLLVLWLYTVVDESSLMLALAAVFVLVFPTRERLFAEAWQRTFATLVGGGLALLILGIATLVAHLPILLLLIFLAGLFLASRMMRGRHPPMVYQFAFSVTIALVVGSLTTQAPLDAMVSRVTLTLTGALVAAFLTSLLELLILGDERDVGASRP